MRKLGFLLTLIALFAFACSPAEEPAPAAAEPIAEPAPEPAPAEDATPGPTAVAVLHNAEGSVVGTATFTQTGSSVTLAANILGLAADQDGSHGFHVHENGTCEPDFKAAGGHFNPAGTDHACPGTAVRHAGDFGNIEIASGGGTLEVSSDLATVDAGPNSVVGKAVILHAGTDDCTAQPTGAAGARLACGVIELQADDMAADAEGESEAAGDGH